MALNLVPIYHSGVKLLHCRNDTPVFFGESTMLQ